VYPIEGDLQEMNLILFDEAGILSPLCKPDHLWSSKEAMYDIMQVR